MRRFLFLIPIALFILFPVTAEAKGTYVDAEIVEVAQKYAEEYCISEHLILAIIENESSGRKYGKNGNCKGLMQVNVDVHQDLMEEFGITDIYDIDGNIHLGTEILYRLILRCDGDIPYALSRYNGVKHAKMLYEDGLMSGYAKRILARTEELEQWSEMQERREAFWRKVKSKFVPAAEHNVKRFIETINFELLEDQKWRTEM